jgi:hypothetical protein
MLRTMQDRIHAGTMQARLEFLGYKPAYCSQTNGFVIAGMGWLSLKQCEEIICKRQYCPRPKSR